MAEHLLLGDEALALGAIDAGISGAYAYPGTPSTEITEFLMRSEEHRSGNLSVAWTTNEKTALEAALGMSYAGKRAMASMKHVGLNVAADPFINGAIAGANGGLVVAVADDPSMHSSQNEQDSRLYTDIALVPCIEPADQQEAYDAAVYAFDLSERLRVPILVRLTTRLAHSRGLVVRRKQRAQNTIDPPEDTTRYILLPATARESYADLVHRQEGFVRESEESPFNSLHPGEDTTLGIIASGIAYSYLLDVTGGSPRNPVLKIGQYPLPLGLIDELLESCKRILVLEEGYPYIETRLRGIPTRTTPEIRGRLTGDLPRTGELTPGAVASAAGIDRTSVRPDSDLPAPRPPALCPGCPHADTCRALNEALADRPEGRVFSDIGCYTLAALPPYEAIDTCVEMGGSITMAKGASTAGLRPAVALIGDSTFTHSGMTGLLDCVNERTDITVVIVDNLTVAMTGGQESAARNRIESICAGLGIEPEHIRVIEPLPQNHERNVAIIRAEIDHPGPSVIIARRECVQTAARRARKVQRKGEG